MGLRLRVRCLRERYLHAADPSREHCLVRTDCRRDPGAEAFFYRAQCLATTRAVTCALDLAPERVTTSFQSRLGRARWIQPSTEDQLVALAGRGVRRVVVLCPSFVADSLETLEEIGLRARARWSELRGESFALAPCLNASPAYVVFLAD